MILLRFECIQSSEGSCASISKMEGRKIQEIELFKAVALIFGANHGERNFS